MKSLIVTAMITLLAGCSSMDMGRHSGSSASGDSSAGANPRLDKQPDDVFHSWIN